LGVKNQHTRIDMRKRNPEYLEGHVQEVILRARWTKWDYRYALEVYVVGKWRGAGYVMARKPRKLTKADVKRVAKSVRINTGGEIAVVGLNLEG
jgi:hypothetical protein